MLIRHRREKVFGPGHAVPLDRNAKCRVMVAARAWSARHRHKGPITRAFLDVLSVLLWQFHNSRSGACFPSYESVATKAGCARSTVAAALKALEFAGVLSWQHRITRVRERCTDLFGNDGWQWRVHRRSNSYAFRDPQQHTERPSAYQSENQPGTLNQVLLASNKGPDTPLERALHQLGTRLLLSRS
jgi:hypothetical protein